MMTLSLDLPDDLAAQLNALLPAEERDHFALSAIADALRTRQRLQQEERLLELLLDEIDPEKEPEREANECRSVVEEELAGVASDGVSIPFSRPGLQRLYNR